MIGIQFNAFLLDGLSVSEGYWAYLVSFLDSSGKLFGQGHYDPGANVQLLPNFKEAA